MRGGLDSKFHSPLSGGVFWRCVFVGPSVAWFFRDGVLRFFAGRFGLLQCISCLCVSSVCCVPACMLRFCCALCLWLQDFYVACVVFGRYHRNLLVLCTVGVARALFCTCRVHAPFSFKWQACSCVCMFLRGLQIRPRLPGSICPSACCVGFQLGALWQFDVCFAFAGSTHDLTSDNCIRSRTR